VGPGRLLRPWTEQWAGTKRLDRPPDESPIAGNSREAHTVQSPTIHGNSAAKDRIPSHF
jgi:hypothetical protein